MEKRWTKKSENEKNFKKNEKNFNKRKCEKISIFAGQRSHVQKKSRFGRQNLKALS